MTDHDQKKVVLVIGAGDATGSAIARRFARVESSIGPIEAFVFNIGANVPCAILEETRRKFRKIWELACYAGFLTSQAVARRTS